MRALEPGPPLERLGARVQALRRRVFELLDRARGARNAEAIAFELLTLLTTYFADEELLMAGASYPDRERHAASHRQLFREAEARVRDLADGHAARALGLSSFARRLRAHVEDEDQAFAAFLSWRGAR